VIIIAKSRSSEKQQKLIPKKRKSRHKSRLEAKKTETSESLKESKTEKPVSNSIPVKTESLTIPQGVSQWKFIKNAVKKLLDDEKLMKLEITLNNPNKFHCKNCVGVLYNKFIFGIQKWMVPSKFKNVLLRTTGLNVGHDACIPHYISFDPYFPELIFLGKGVMLGGLSTMIAHTVKGNKLTVGKNIIAERVLQGGFSTMMPGSMISNYSILNMDSCLEGIVPEGELWGGRPAKLMMKFDQATIDKYYAPAKYDPNYYKDFRKKMKAFWKNKELTYFKAYYSGRRLTAGNDWWRARNVISIFWSGVLVEMCIRLNHSWFKTLLLRLAGAKIGKNCRIAKGVVFDHLMTPTIHVGNNVKLDENVYLDGHEYTATQTVFGRIFIKDNVYIKKNTAVRIGCVIGENTIIEADSFAQREIPANEVWGGRPAKFIRKV